MIIQTNMYFVDMLDSFHQQGAELTFDGQWHHIQSEALTGRCTQRSFAEGFEFRVWELQIHQDVTMYRKGEDTDRWFLTLILGSAELEDKRGDVKFGKDNLCTVEFHNLKRDDEFVIRGGGSMLTCAFHVNSQGLKGLLSDDDVEVEELIDSKKPLAMYELVDRKSRAEFRDSLKVDVGDEFGRRLLYNSMEYIYLSNLQKFVNRLRGLHHVSVDTDAQSYQRMLKASTLFNDYRNPPSLETLSKFVGLNTMATNELFKQVYGKTPYQFFNEKRLNEAYQLISDANMRIADVGVRLGYGNMSHFSKVFKKQYGILPKQLQMQNA